VAGHPFGAFRFECLDLVLGGAVKLLARDIFIDFRGTFPVRAVRAAEIPGVGNTCGAVLVAVPSELTGTGIAAVKAAGCSVLTVPERLPVVSAREASTIGFAFTARTITIRPIVPVTVGLVPAITIGFAVTVAERLAVSPAEGLAVTVAFTARTVTEGLTVTVTEGLTLTAGETTTLALALTARTITIRLTLTVTERLTLTAAETTTLPLALTARTITIRLALTITERLTITRTGSTAWPVGVPVFAGPEAAGLSARVVGSAERSAVFSAAVAAVVLSHVGFLLLRADHWRNRSRSSRCFVFYATRNQALPSPYICINSRRVALWRVTGIASRPSS
jgi:hypothetical protein